jgi:hypothetical protein
LPLGRGRLAGRSKRRIISCLFAVTASSVPATFAAGSASLVVTAVCSMTAGASSPVISVLTSG